MTTVGKTTVNTAPRDKGQLVRLGRFQLRALALELGLVATEDSKTAYAAMTVEDQAQAILDALKAQGGAPSAPSAPASPAADKPKRTPVGAPQTQAPTQAPADTSGNLDVVMEVLTKVLENTALLHEKIDAINEKLGRSEIDSALGLTLGLMLAEQSMGAGRDDILTAVFEDAPGIQAKVTATLGKGKKKK